MPTPPEDRAFTLRLAELAIQELRWQGIATKANLERITPLVDDLASWRRDMERREKERDRLLTQREKLLASVLVIASPALTVVFQHFLR